MLSILAKVKIAFTKKKPLSVKQKQLKNKSTKLVWKLKLRLKNTKQKQQNLQRLPLNMW